MRPHPTSWGKSIDLVVAERAPCPRKLRNHGLAHWKCLHDTETGTERCLLDRPESVRLDEVVEEIGEARNRRRPQASLLHQIWRIMKRSMCAP